MTLTLVGLAAGMGSRFGGPKQLEPLGPSGETMLDYAIHDAMRAGFERVVLVVRREMRDAFERGVVARWGPRIPIELVCQSIDAVPAGFSRPESRTKPWGTGQAVLAAEPAVPGSFAVVNADDFYGPDAYASLAAHLRAAEGATPPRWAVVGFPLRDTLTEAGTVNRAVLTVDPRGRLQHVEEILGIAWRGDGGVHRDGAGIERELVADTPVSMNMWGFDRTLFDRLESGFRRFLEQRGQEEKSEYLVQAEVQDALRDGAAEVVVLPGTGPWAGVTHPEDRGRVAGVLADLARRGVYPPALALTATAPP